MAVMILGGVLCFFVLLVLVFWRRRGSYESINKHVPAHVRRLRVAVVGGGIAGAGAAWTLAESGIDVTLLERESRVGGNANQHDFELRNGQSVRTGLSVLAWPDRYFKHYEALLNRLNVERESVQLPFLVHEEASDSFSLNHMADESDIVGAAYKADMKRWNRMIWLIRTVGRIFSGGGVQSLYDFSFANPFNLVPLRLFARFFVTDAFWTNVCVPIYSTTFLTSNLGRIPCVIAPIMHDIIPLDQCPRLNTWSEDSGQVFQRMLRNVNVVVNAKVEAVEEHANFVEVKIAGKASIAFDRVVFACDANSVASMLVRPPWLLRTVLGRIAYVDDQAGADFLDGVIHRSAVPAVPLKARPFLSKMSNYVRVNKAGELSNTFVLSSWVPRVKALGIDFSKESLFLVSYGREVLEKIGSNFVAPVRFRYAHPFLCVTNLVCAFVMRFIHNPRTSPLIFCGSWTTPGNGHDLSLCSGIAAAHALGARYPFLEMGPDMCAEFVRARRVIGL